LLSPELVAGISRVRGVKQLGFRSGNWLSAEQSSEALKHSCGERQAIEDALNNLGVLKREDAAITAEEERKAAQAALERLRSIAPRIKRASEG
jgi:hypothetical protein